MLVARNMLHDLIFSIALDKVQTVRPGSSNHLWDVVKLFAESLYKSNKIGNGEY